MINRPDRPVFYDKMSLLPGMDWREEIEKTLEKCQLVLILCSPHIVAKEGFIQKEIRLALERSEMMPEGRIFIMPIRFDNSDVPRKIARYQWLDIKSDDDLFEIAYYVDLVWSQIMNIKPDYDGMTPADMAILSREEIVMLMQGKNTEGERVFCYLKLSVLSLVELKNKIVQLQDFQPSDFGTVIASDHGYPSAELREEMRLKYSLTSSEPSSQSTEKHKKQLLQDEFIKGYREAYLGVVGTDIEIPLIQAPEVFHENSSPLREGIRYGMKVALEYLSNKGS
jgi:hypothetical protein